MARLAVRYDGRGYASSSSSSSNSYLRPSDEETDKLLRQLLAELEKQKSASPKQILSETVDSRPHPSGTKGLATLASPQQTKNSSSRQTGSTLLSKNISYQRPDRLLGQLSKHQFVYSLSGIILGFTCIVGGAGLFLNGISGSMNWLARFLGAESNITNAAPGVILFIVGVFMVWVTRYDFSIKE